MGQYWKALTKQAKKTQLKVDFSDKDVVAYCGYSAKLCELSHFREPLVHHLMSLIVTKPTALLLVGDYGEPLPGVKDEDGYDVNLYSLHDKECFLVTSPHGVYFDLDPTKTVTAGADSKSPFLLNYRLKECIRVKDDKGKHLDAFNGVHPLPLLVASPDENGKGGGDWQHSDGDVKYVGKWAGDVIGCGKSIPKGFTEIKCFQEAVEEDEEPIGGKTVLSHRSARLSAEEDYNVSSGRRGKNSAGFSLRRSNRLSKSL